MTNKGWHQRKHKRTSTNGNQFSAGKLAKSKIEKLAKDDFVVDDALSFIQMKNLASDIDTSSLKEDPNAREEVIFKAIKAGWDSDIGERNAHRTRYWD